MQTLLIILLTSVGLSYCLESMFPLHERTLKRIKEEDRKFYITAKARIYFCTAFLSMAIEIARQAGQISEVQGWWINAGILTIAFCIAFLIKRKYMESVVRRTGVQGQNRFRLRTTDEK